MREPRWCTALQNSPRLPLCVLGLESDAVDTGTAALEIGKRAMWTPSAESYSWKSIESAPLDKDVTLQVTDGRGGPYTLRWPCRRTASGWINSSKGTPLAVTPVRWRPYDDRPSRPR
jgi:hypothetical protein